MQPVVFPDSAELVINDFTQDGTDDLVVVDLRTGDLLASGTISGPTNDSRGSLLELAWRGEEPLSLDSGEQRSSVQDGDIVTLTGWCQGDGYRVGFGECTGQLLAAH